MLTQLQKNGIKVDEEIHGALDNLRWADRMRGSGTRICNFARSLALQSVAHAWMALAVGHD